MPKTILTLTASDPYLAGRMAAKLKRVIDLHALCQSKLEAADDRYDRAKAVNWCAAELDDAQPERAELVLLLHALEDAARPPVEPAAKPVARPASDTLAALYPVPVV